MAIRGGNMAIYSQISPGGKLLYSHFFGGKFYYIAIFPGGGGMTRGKNYYTTPVIPTRKVTKAQPPIIVRLPSHV